MRVYAYSNAYKYCLSGSIRIHLKYGPTHVEFGVKDVRLLAGMRFGLDRALMEEKLTFLCTLCSIRAITSRVSAFQVRGAWFSFFLSFFLLASRLKTLG